jgi:hypothetical protein
MLNINILDTLNENASGTRETEREVVDDGRCLGPRLH